MFLADISSKSIWQSSNAGTNRRGWLVRARTKAARGLLPAAVGWPTESCFSRFVVTGHSRSKNGVASLAYVPVTSLRDALPT
jgi:hypothetical protein